jgi:four helix bundle protein
LPDSRSDTRCESHVGKPGTSIGANIEEGQAGQSRADYISKYCVACKEARETHYWLRLLAASDVIPKIKLQDLSDEANQIVAILTSIIKKARANKEREDRAKA